jgi:hypothetical protein
MKKVSLSIVTAFVFFLAMAVAQNTTQGAAGSAGTEQSSPSMSQGTSGSQGGSGGMQGSSSSMKHKGMKGEKTLKGCVRSEGGQYMLEEKSGKMVNLTGSDVSAHVGHEVRVEGMWEKGSPESASAASSGAGMSANHMFNVTNVSMVSDTCTMGKKSKGGSMSKSGSSTTQPPQ